MPNAIIIGASSGIGRALAVELAKAGYRVGLMARRTDLLRQAQAEIGKRTLIKTLDIAQTSEAMQGLKDLIAEMGGADLVVISAGVGFLNPDLEWDKEAQTVDVNVRGFAAMANVAFHHFIDRKAGHLVGISSIAALTGSPHAPAYNASKAFESNYLSGLRRRSRQLKLPITVTDIQPGFVDTAMAKGEHMFWVASPQKAARQILQAILKRRSHAYITKRWRLIAWAIRILLG